MTNNIVTDEIPRPPIHCIVEYNENVIEMYGDLSSCIINLRRPNNLINYKIYYHRKSIVYHVY